MTISTKRSSTLLPALLLATALSSPAAAQIVALPVVDALADPDTRVTLAGGKITALEGQVTAAATVSAALRTDVTALTNSVASNSAAIANLTTRAGTQTAAVAAIDGRVAVHDAAIGALSTTTAAVAAQVGGQGKALTDIGAKVVGHDGAIATLTTQAVDVAAKVDVQAKALADVGTKVAGHHTAIGTLTTQTAAVAGTVAELGGKIDAATALAADVGVKIDKVAVDVAATGQAVVSLGDRVTVAETTINTTIQTVNDLNVRTTANTGAIAALDVRVGDNSAAIARERVRNDAQDRTLADHATRIDQVGATADASLAATQNLRADVTAGRIGIVQVGADGGITVGAGISGTSVSVAGTAGPRRISGVAAGTATDDVVTVGQMTGAMANTLASANQYTDQQVLRALDRQMGATQAMIADNNVMLRQQMNGVAAHGAALSGLPQAIEPGRGFAGMSIGGKGGEVAVALGLSKAFTGDHAPVLRAGAAVDTRRGDMTYNAGVGIHF